ncbi:hypothetical protein LCGC14_0386410 [marine sediment metagenome]|uniref:HNH nuclease domain-containing protein n=1 Tax=marine sediment metagenome TaxID=412755 RepID=A0A0F9TJ30_9ZZZZ
MQGRKAIYTADQLREMYWEQNMTTTEISKLFGVGMSAVAHAMNRLGVPKRSHGEQLRKQYELGKITAPLTGRAMVNWRGGRMTKAGYIYEKLHESHRFWCMARKGGGHQHGYAAQHRLVMAEHLGRPLVTEDIVHHLNGQRADNRLENLSLVDRRTHPTWAFQHAMQERIRTLEAHIANIAQLKMV